MWTHKQRTLTSWLYSIFPWKEHIVCVVHTLRIHYILIRYIHSNFTPTETETETETKTDFVFFFFLRSIYFFSILFAYFVWYFISMRTYACSHKTAKRRRYTNYTNNKNLAPIECRSLYKKKWKWTTERRLNVLVVYSVRPSVHVCMCGFVGYVFSCISQKQSPHRLFFFL